MVSTGHALAFTAASFLLIAIPGPNVVFTIGRALAVGRRDALLTVVGGAAGAYLQAVAVAFGVSTLAEDSIVAFNVVKFAGAAYLVYLGFQAIRHRRSLAESLSRQAAPTRARRAMLDGFIVGAANPKSIVFLAALLPEFTDPAAGGLQLQLLVLGAVFSLVALAGTSAWALAAGTARAWLARSPRRLATIGGAGGLVMIGLGVSVAATRRVR
jgi:threonine/homoserine/homoserine lactone efflux protein